MRRVLIAIFFYFFINLTFSYSQHIIPLDEKAYLAQLTSQIEANKNDSITILNNFLLSNYWSQLDSSKSLLFLKKNESLANKSKILTRVSPYFWGQYYLGKEDKKQAIKQYENSIKQLSTFHDSLSISLLALSYYQFSYLQANQNGYQSLIETITNQCIPLTKKNNNEELEAYFYTQIGLAFMSVGQFKKAEEQHNVALELLKNIPTNSIHLLTYLNSISNYCYQANSASAKPYLDKSTSLINQYPDSRHITNYYYQLAMFQTTRTQYKEAQSTLQKGIQEAKKRKQTQFLQIMHFRMYNTYLMQNEYQMAKKYMEDIVTEGILTQDPVNRKHVFAQMTHINELLNNYPEAYSWQKRTLALSDSLQQANLLEKMNELEILHRTSEQKNTIDELKLKQIENELATKNTNIKLLGIAIALVILLLISSILFLTIRNQKKLNKQISINHHQELQRLEQQRKYDASQAVLIGEENERKRIAQDLHDSVGSMLAGIRMKLAIDEKRDSKVIEEIDKSLAEVRRISRNIMPETLENRGLKEALQELCQSMNNQHTHFHFESFELSHKIPYNIQISLYRICQEAISNIIKYAHATEVIIQLSQNNNTLQLVIEDDGIGFDLKNTSTGLGIKNMENRMHLHQGSFSIYSAINEGTTITATCQINE